MLRPRGPPPDPRHAKHLRVCAAGSLLLTALAAAWALPWPRLPDGASLGASLLHSLAGDLPPGLTLVLLVLVPAMAWLCLGLVPGLA